MGKIQDFFDTIFKNKKNILVVMPHPDDTELYCGGTVARLIASGKEVRIVKMTFGEKGCKQVDISPENLKKIREKEDKESMRTLGIKDENNIYLDLGDGNVLNNFPTIEKIVKQIRSFQPDLIITTNPEDMIIRFSGNVNWINHWDHINTGKAVLNASYPYSRDISFFPEHFKNMDIKSHICTNFLLTDYYNHADSVFIDVTNFIEKRIKAHACHISQYNLKDAQDSADFFTKSSQYPQGKRFETFRYVLVD
jgi:LmbE family N-acetylglucosaminyl deacetylase